LTELRQQCERTLRELERQRELAQDADRLRVLVTERCRELADGRKISILRASGHF
jgi:hypothetical protein